MSLRLIQHSINDGSVEPSHLDNDIKEIGRKTVDFRTREWKCHVVTPILLQEYYQPVPMEDSSCKSMKMIGDGVEWMTAVIF